jgi:hypothetical protein
MNSNSLLIFPEDFDDYAWQLESKGWFSGATLDYQGRRYPLSFFDPVRLAQDIERVLQAGETFCEPNLVVIPTVTRENMEKAAAWLVASSNLQSLVAE